MTYTVGLVELEGLSPVLAQYDPVERWNGWLSPKLDALSTVQVLDEINADSVEGEVYSYDFLDGVLLIDDMLDPELPTERVEPDEDGLYSLGASAWVWSAVREPERAVRHLRVVPDRPEVPVCMYADTGHGPCGGPVTNVGDCNNYCWLHKDLRRRE